MLLFLMICQAFNAQTYSYSFKGVLSNENKAKFNKEISELPTLLSVEIKIKNEAQMGEVIFSIDPLADRGENDHPFSPVDLKSLLISFGLEPIDFRQLK